MQKIDKEMIEVTKLGNKTFDMLNKKEDRNKDNVCKLIEQTTKNIRVLNKRRKQNTNSRKEDRNN